MLVTSRRRKDLVVTKVARLGRFSCRLVGEAGQNMSLVQKLGCGTVITSISMVLPQLHQSMEPAGNLLPLSSRQLSVEERKDDKLAAEEGEMGLPLQ